MGERVLMDLSDQELRDEYCVTDCEFRKLHDGKAATPTSISPATCGEFARRANMPAACGLAVISVEIVASTKEGEIHA